MCWQYLFCVDGREDGKLYGEDVFRLCPEINQGTKLLSLGSDIPSRARALAPDIRWCYTTWFTTNKLTHVASNKPASNSRD